MSWANVKITLLSKNVFFDKQEANKLPKLVKKENNQFQSPL